MRVPALTARRWEAESWSRPRSIRWRAEVRPAAGRSRPQCGHLRASRRNPGQSIGPVERRAPRRGMRQRSRMTPVQSIREAPAVARDTAALRTGGVEPGSSRAPRRLDTPPEGQRRSWQRLAAVRSCRARRACAAGAAETSSFAAMTGPISRRPQVPGPALEARARVHEWRKAARTPLRHRTVQPAGPQLRLPVASCRCRPGRSESPGEQPDEQAFARRPRCHLLDR